MADPKIIEKPAMILVGSVGCGTDVRDIDISGLWQRFTQQEHQIKHVIGEVGYELHIEEDNQPRLHFCLVGFEVSKIDDLPIEYFVKILPPCKYARFTHTFSKGDYSDAFVAAYKWIENSDYKPAHAYDIQAYDERFKGSEDPESMIEILIPITAKS